MQAKRLSAVVSHPIGLLDRWIAAEVEALVLTERVKNRDRKLAILANKTKKRDSAYELLEWLRGAASQSQLESVQCAAEQAEKSYFKHDQAWSQAEHAARQARNEVYHLSAPFRGLLDVRASLSRFPESPCRDPGDKFALANWKSARLSTLENHKGIARRQYRAISESLPEYQELREAERAKDKAIAGEEAARESIRCFESASSIKTSARITKAMKDARADHKRLKAAICAPINAFDSANQAYESAIKENKRLKLARELIAALEGLSGTITKARICKKKAAA